MIHMSWFPLFGAKMCHYDLVFDKESCIGFDLVLVVTAVSIAFDLVNTPVDLYHFDFANSTVLGVVRSIFIALSNQLNLESCSLVHC